MRGRREGLGRGLKREAEARLLPFALGMDCCLRDGHENMGQGPAGWMAGNFARSAIPADWLRSPSPAHFAPDQWRRPQAETDHRLVPSSGGRFQMAIRWRALHFTAGEKGSSLWPSDR